MLVCAVVSACGDDAVPFDQIPKDKPLLQLSSSEREGACDWVTQLAHQRLMPNGMALTCHGTTINVSSCGFPSATQTQCVATFGQWAACMPGFLDAIAADPCKVLDLAFSQTELESFVNGIPGCEGIGPCAYTIMQ
jgi:hypothetical protein